MKKLITAILSILFLAAFIPARWSTTNIVHPDTTRKPYIMVMRDEYGNMSSYYVKGYYNPIPSKSVLFNFNATGQNIAGTIDVSGRPDTGSISVLDSSTGWMLKTSDVSGSWPTFANNSSNSLGEPISDGGGFAFGKDVGISGWYAAGFGTFTLKSQIQLYNLDTLKTYTIQLLASSDSSNHVHDGSWEAMYAQGKIDQGWDTVYMIGNTSHLVTFTMKPKVVNNVGEILINLDGGGTPANGYKWFTINALKITEEQ